MCFTHVLCVFYPTRSREAAEAKAGGDAPAASTEAADAAVDAANGGGGHTLWGKDRVAVIAQTPGLWV